MAGRGKRVTDKEILEVFLSGDDPVYSASQIAANIEIGTAGTDARLRNFEQKRLVKSKKIGPSRAWWITERGKKFVQGEYGDVDEVDPTNTSNEPNS